MKASGSHQKNKSREEANEAFELESHCSNTSRLFSQAKGSLISETTEFNENANEMLRNKVREQARMIVELKQQIMKLSKNEKAQESAREPSSARKMGEKDEVMSLKQRISELSFSLATKEHRVVELEEKLALSIRAEINPSPGVTSTSFNEKKPSSPDQLSQLLFELQSKAFDPVNGKPNEGFNGLFRKLTSAVGIQQSEIKELKSEKAFLEETLRSETLENEKQRQVNKMLQEMAEMHLETLSIPSSYHDSAYFLSRIIRSC